MTRYRAPRLLEATHRLDGFSCRSAEQTTWLQQHSRQSSSANSTRVFAVAPLGSRDVVAYYAWCMAQIRLESAPPRLLKGAGRYPQPVALLARLGVHVDHEGQGLGAGLLTDAIVRLVALSEDIGCRGLLIHAETTSARDFYLHLIPELAPSPTDDLHLVLRMKDARRTMLG